MINDKVTQLLREVESGAVSVERRPVTHWRASASQRKTTSRRSTTASSTPRSREPSYVLASPHQANRGW